jgi:hypothetical protein
LGAFFGVALIAFVGFFIYKRRTAKGGAKAPVPAQAVSTPFVTEARPVPTKPVRPQPQASAPLPPTYAPQMLPPGWKAVRDPGTGDVYYWNTSTGEP